MEKRKAILKKFKHDNAIRTIAAMTMIELRYNQTTIDNKNCNGIILSTAAYVPTIAKVTIECSGINFADIYTDVEDIKDVEKIRILLDEKYNIKMTYNDSVLIITKLFIYNCHRYILYKYLNIDNLSFNELIEEE